MINRRKSDSKLLTTSPPAKIHRKRSVQGVRAQTRDVQRGLEVREAGIERGQTLTPH